MNIASTIINIKRLLTILVFGCLISLKAQSPDPSNVITDGDLVYVNPPSFVASNKDALMRVHEYALSKDAEAVQQMIEDGRVAITTEPMPAELKKTEKVKGWDNGDKPSIALVRPRGIDGTVW